jgi:hypothetical protein
MCGMKRHHQLTSGDDEPSPAAHFIRFFREHQGYQQGRSNERWNAGMRECLRVAIRYGLRFDKEDFAVMTQPNARHNCTGHPMGISLDVREWEYAIACGSERGILNLSAAQAYEHALKRKPFLIEDDHDTTTPTRIYEGREFKWYGKTIKCTSFAEDQQSLIACTYKPQEKGTYERKLDKRIRITHDDIKEHRKCRALAIRLREHANTISTDDAKAMLPKIVEHCGTTSPFEMTMEQLTWVAELVGLPEETPVAAEATT